MNELHEVVHHTTRRALGRQVIVDHHWRCSCGTASTPATGFSSTLDAEVNAAFRPCIPRKGPAPR